MQIEKACAADLPRVYQLQQIAFQSEAELFGTSRIPPLMETLADLQKVFEQGTLYVALDEDGRLLGSVRGQVAEGTLFIGKLMVDPLRQRQGIGRQLLAFIEEQFPGLRKELFTSSLSRNNICLYESAGYVKFKEEQKGMFLFFYYQKDAGAL